MLNLGGSNPGANTIYNLQGLDFIQVFQIVTRIDIVHEHFKQSTGSKMWFDSYCAWTF